MSAEPEALFHRNVALVEFDSEQKAREILDASGLRAYVIRELTPTAYLVDPKKAAMLADRFGELGYTPNVQGSD